jgi:hypothetical protein
MSRRQETSGRRRAGGGRPRGLSPGEGGCTAFYPSCCRIAARFECCDILFSAHQGQNMIKRLLLITCAAYLVAASPACAQHDPGYRDGCGGSCATGAPYDLGYHDGYEGDSYTSSEELKSDPQYEAGFSEGEMDAMDEKEARAAEKQAREERLDSQDDGRSIASRRAPDQDRAQDRESERALGREDDRELDRQTDSTLDALLSGQSDMARMDEEDALTAQEQAGGWRLMDRRRDSYTDPDAGLLTFERNSNN